MREDKREQERTAERDTVKNSFNPELNRYADLDFADAKPVEDVRVLAQLFHFYIIREREGEEGDSTNVQLAKPTNFTDDLEMKLQAAKGSKSRITNRVDNIPLTAFKVRAGHSGDGYQTLMNEALKQFVQRQTLADVVRGTIRIELHAV